MGVLVDPVQNSPNQNHMNCMADTRKNNYQDLGSKGVKIMYPVYLIFLKHLSRWNPQIWLASFLQYRPWSGISMPISCGFSVPLMLPPFLLLSLLPHSFPLFSFSDFSSLSSHINWIESKVYKFVLLQWFIRHVPPYSDTCRPFNTTGNFKSWIVFFYDNSPLETHFHLN